MKHSRSPNDSAKNSSASPDSRGPPPEPTSSFRSSYSTGPFSLREESSDSVTDLDGWTAESSDSESDDEELNVIQLLDIRLVSVLSGDLDLAARLIPKIHNLLESEIHAEIPDFTDSTIQDHTSHQGGGANKGKQRASGSSSSGRSNRTSFPAPLKESMDVTRGVRMEVVRGAIRARNPDGNPAGILVHPETAIRGIRVMARTEAILIRSVAVPQLILIETLVIQVIQETSLWRKTFLVIPSLHAIFRSVIISNTDPGTRNMQCVPVVAWKSYVVSSKATDCS
jgi:hypothetical protein